MSLVQELSARPEASTLEILLGAYRAANPNARNMHAIKHANTASRRQRVCVLCGEGSPTCSAKYAPTKRYSAWEETHACWNAYTADAARVRADAWLESGAVGPLVVRATDADGAATPLFAALTDAEIVEKHGAEHLAYLKSAGYR